MRNSQEIVKFSFPLLLGHTPLSLQLLMKSLFISVIEREGSPLQSQISALVMKVRSVFFLCVCYIFVCFCYIFLFVILLCISPLITIK